MRRLTTDRLLPLAGTVAGIGATSVLIGLVRAFIAIPNLSVLYLLPVMFCAVTWGWWFALAAALLGFLSYNFFFIEPVHTFTISDPEEWVALLIFLAVAAVTSNLAARERARREEARRQARTATLLYEISRSLGGDDLEPALRDVAERIVRELRLDGAVVDLDDGGGRAAPRIVVGKCGPALGPRPAGRVFASAAAGERPGRWVIVRGAGRAGTRPSRARRWPTSRSAVATASGACSGSSDGRTASPTTRRAS